MIDGSDKSDFRSFEGIVSGKLRIKQEESILVRSFLGPEHQDFPQIDVRTRVNGDKWMWVFTIDLDLLSYTFKTGISRNLFRFLGAFHLFEDFLG